MATKRHNAGAYDIRAIIAYLLGIYGVVLVGYGLFDFTDAEKEKSDGFNINLWAGLAMIVVAAIFLVWNKLKPTKVPDDQLEHSDTDDSGPPPGH
jgi:hypothetical protein